jgi:hypothetical protein
LAALWQVALARYLPADVPVASTFWTTYLGPALASSLTLIFGAVAVLATPVGMDTMDAVKLVTGAIGPLMLELFLLSVISHNALNLYGAVLSIITLCWCCSVKARRCLRNTGRFILHIFKHCSVDTIQLHFFHVASTRINDKAQILAENHLHRDYCKSNETYSPCITSAIAVTSVHFGSLHQCQL